MQHFHGYLWTGEKPDFDKESRRRLPIAPWPTADADANAQRTATYRALTDDFHHSPVPPVEVAHWLLKPARLALGSWPQAEEAAGWLRERLAEYAPRIDADAYRDPVRLDGLATGATGTLSWGGDVSLGFYLGRPAYLSLALVTCSPNRAKPELPCPAP